MCNEILGNYSKKEDQLMTARSEEHTSELQSPCNLVCRLLLEKKKNTESYIHLITRGNGATAINQIVLEDATTAKMDGPRSDAVGYGLPAEPEATDRRELMRA